MNLVSVGFGRRIALGGTRLVKNNPTVSPVVILELNSCAAKDVKNHYFLSCGVTLAAAGSAAENAQSSAMQMVELDGVAGCGQSSPEVELWAIRATTCRQRRSDEGRPRV
jgi:hypothetical protein